ncbi:actin 11 [Pelomyxa schiedti]|nr:actin 11 [Pelomyxa schiedti]
MISLNFEMEMRGPVRTEKYRLPDGRLVPVGVERVKCPEALFQPNIRGMKGNCGCALGLHELCYEAIKQCDPEVRGKLYGNIVLSGGSTLFPNMKERMRKEMGTLAPTLAPVSLKVKVVAPEERACSAWLGGSIVASLGSFPGMCVTKEEYSSCGPSIIHTKC